MDRLDPREERRDPELDTDSQVGYAGVPAAGEPGADRTDRTGYTARDTGYAAGGTGNPPGNAGTMADPVNGGAGYGTSMASGPSATGTGARDAEGTVYDTTAGTRYDSTADAATTGMGTGATVGSAGTAFGGPGMTNGRMDPWNRDEQAGWGADEEIVGYAVEADDGRIGKVDEASTAVDASYVVVDTGPWIFGKKVMVPAGVIQRVDTADQRVYVGCTKDQIKNSPEFDPATYTTPEYRDSLGSYYSGRDDDYPG